MNSDQRVSAGFHWDSGVALSSFADGTAAAISSDHTEISAMTQQ